MEYMLRELIVCINRYHLFCIYRKEKRKSTPVGVYGRLQIDHGVPSALSHVLGGRLEGPQASGGELCPFSWSLYAVELIPSSFLHSFTLLWTTRCVCTAWTCSSCNRFLACGFSMPSSDSAVRVVMCIVPGKAK